MEGIEQLVLDFMAEQLAQLPGKATLQINQIMQAAQEGDPKAQLLAEAIKTVALKYASRKARKARLGAKLDYLNTLKNNCSEGEELVFLKSGGCMCQKRDRIEEAKCGTKVKKHCGGGISKTVKAIKAELGTKAKENPYRAGGKDKDGNTIIVNKETSLTYRVPFIKGTRNDSITLAVTTPDLRGYYPTKSESEKMVDAANAARLASKHINSTKRK